MSLPPPEVAREAQHTRTIKVNTFAREDGLWDLEAELIDFKSYDFEKRAGAIQPAGSPIHHMLLRVTIDAQFTITDAVAAYKAAPYDAHCMSIADDYNGLIGLNLLRKFRDAVKQRFSRTNGCTHMTELSYVLPTVAVQTMANRRSEQRVAESRSTKRPFQLEGCHALGLSSPVVKEHYPTWYVKPQVSDGG